MGCISEPEAIMFRRSGLMKQACVITSRNRRRKTHGWINSSFSMMNVTTARWSDNLLNYRFERFTNSSYRLCRWKVIS